MSSLGAPVSLPVRVSSFREAVSSCSRKLLPPFVSDLFAASILRQKKEANSTGTVHDERRAVSRTLTPAHTFGVITLYPRKTCLNFEQVQSMPPLCIMQPPPAHRKGACLGRTLLRLSSHPITNKSLLPGFPVIWRSLGRSSAGLEHLDSLTRPEPYEQLHFCTPSPHQRLTTNMPWARSRVHCVSRQL